MFKTSNRYGDLIRKIFLGLLQREVDKSSFDFYSEKLSSKKMSVEEFINYVLNSDEYQAIQKNKSENNTSLFLKWSPAGHYYSPIPSMEDIKSRESKIFSKTETILGINLNQEKQIQTLSNFSEFYADLPFTENKNKKLRYYYDNGFFSYADAIVLYSMMRLIKPKNIIEVGSGFSSAVILDTNELFFNNKISCRFIEPYPERLLSLIKNNESAMLNKEKLENVDIKFFDDLIANDILFIDSSHVSKIGSDVNYLFSEIIPRLKKGVYIHIHDIISPFEYPPEWVYEGRCWNEAYILKSFLQYNDSFEIIFWNDYIGKHHNKKIASQLPLALKNIGTSFWMQKTR